MTSFFGMIPANVWFETSTDFVIAQIPILPLHEQITVPTGYGLRFILLIVSSLTFWCEYFFPPIKILEKVGIAAGSNVLDFGAGSGSYSVSAAQLVRPAGKVYAADIHILAIREIRKKADMKGIKNIHTIHTDCETKLPDASIDVVLLFYVL